MSTILHVSHISKQYRLGLVGSRTLKDDFTRWWYRVRGKEDPFLTIGAVNNRSAQAQEDYVWALRDINFEVAEGEVLGIIGKNGAGKSTLLKILSRVTSPTTGVIKTRGRIASLLEVGTGFHPELTGRENIYLNGTILGMSRSEIKSKEEEIVAFSGCEMYIDTPVKRYSSGMRVRLAFAVAAHLEPDILVVDEVLAVGDAEFQKKAVGKMQDISTGEGRTVLFVSHNMAAVKSLCTRGIVLEHGTVVFDGATDEAVDYYLKNNVARDASRTDQIDSPIVTIDSVQIIAQGKKVGDPIYMDDEVLCKVTFTKKVEDPIGMNFRIKDADENILFTNGSLDKLLNEGKIGTFSYAMGIPKNIFNVGEFLVDFGCVHHNKFHFLKENYLSFEINPKAKKVGGYFGKSKGSLRLDLKWQDFTS